MKMTGLFYAPYIPFSIMNVKYQLIKTLDNVDTIWYTVKVSSIDEIEWILQYNQGWRYTPISHGFYLIDIDFFDLNEQLYTFFVLRFG